MKPYIGYSFSIITDHQSLKYLQSMKNPSGRIAMTLQQFDFDALSRELDSICTVDTEDIQTN